MLGVVVYGCQRVFWQHDNNYHNVVILVQVLLLQGGDYTRCLPKSPL